MASFYPSEGDMLPTAYLLNQNLLSEASLSSAQPNSIPDEDPHMLSKQSAHASGQVQANYGLSLTLGCEESFHPDLNLYTNTSLRSLLTSDVNQSELHLCPNNSQKNEQYLSFDFSGRAQEGTSLPYLHQVPEFNPTICNSKYLKAARDLLDELVSVHKAPKQSEEDYNCSQDTPALESTVNNSRDIPPSERHDLQNKVVRLSDMIDEVNRRYRQYYHQMQVVVSTFDALAGHGAAKPYTALALRTISCQFGSLRNAIKKQIRAAQNRLGENDTNPHGILTRLRNMDQKLRQQRALHQFGVARQPWRPQRGLPENAVTVLRAWLFEHFLHPYPKDSEKMVLARQTGLTRSQVANWFINARVRLWKPMIEEMYKEEFGDPESESKSHPDDGKETMQSSELMLPDVISHAQIDQDGASAGLSFENVPFQGNQLNFENSNW